MTRPPVAVTHWVHDEVAAYLSEFAEVHRPTSGVWSRSDIPGGAHGLICSMADRVDDELLASLPQLRIVSATLKGFDNFDVEACTRRGVWLTVVPDLLIGPTAELGIGLLIGVLRRVAEGDRLVKDGRFVGWRPQLYGTGLAGSTIGLLGRGALGGAVARRLDGFGVEVIHHDPGVGGSQALDRVLATSDAVVCTLPLTPSTRGLIDAGALARMRPGAVLVNIGRGSVVDEDAVAASLGAGHLGGYAADVFALEDWALPGRPSVVSERLRSHPRTLFTPHLGSAVDDVRRAMSLAAAAQVRQVFEGRRPDHPVNDPAARRPAD